MSRSTQIENRNFLSPVGFKFILTKSPKVAFFCNQATIPDITLGLAVQPNYLTEIPQPGEKLTFGDLNLRFLIDENLENYMEIQNWMRGLGFPESLQQIYDLQETGNPELDLPSRMMQNIYSDGTLQILSSSMIPKYQVQFKDLFPYSLSTVTFDATNTDIEYFTADVTFKYTYYTMTTVSGNRI